MTAPTLLPPPGPALLLHMAAAKLRRAAEATRAAGEARTPAQWAAYLDNVLGGPLGEFCGLMTPQLALDLCDWLDAVAAQAVRQARAGGTEHAITGGFPDAAARSILGETS